MGLKPKQGGNRAVFEEVSTPSRPAATPGAIDRGRGGARAAIPGGQVEAVTPSAATLFGLAPNTGARELAGDGLPQGCQLEGALH